MERPPESEWVRLASRGDAAAFGELVRVHHAGVYRIAAALLGRDEAEDATQETFVRIHRGLPDFAGQAAFGTWVYRIATNVALNRLRSRSRRPLRALPETLELPSREPGPIAHTEAEELRAALQAALGQLPPEQQAVVLLRGVEGLSFEEVSRVLEIPLPTAQSRMSRARARLRQLLSAFLPPDAEGSP